jgi:DNA invertase Pin-like site-specific DNA recombinase
MLTVLAAVAQFEHTRLAERLTDAKAQLRHEGRHTGGTRPFGFRLAKPPKGMKGVAPLLVPIPEEQAAIKDIVRLRGEGLPLMRIQAAIAQRGFRLSYQTVANVIERARHAAAA